MRIALLIDAWFPYWGGGQVNAWEISRRLVENQKSKIKNQKYKSKVKDKEISEVLGSGGVDIDIFTRKLRGEGREVAPALEEFESGRLRVFRLGPVAPLFFYPVRVWCLAMTMVKVVAGHLKNPYDIIHVHAIAPVLPGKVLSLLLRKPLVLTIHGVNVLETSPRLLLARLERWLLTGIAADEVISVQEHFRDFPSVHRKVMVIPNGVEVEEYDLVKVRKSGVFKIVWVGRFQRVKGLEVLLRAVRNIKYQRSNFKYADKKLNMGGKSDKILNQVQNDGEDEGRPVFEFELHLIGGGGDAGYEREIHELVRKLGLERVVKFRGVITGEEKIKELKSAQLFVLPSLSEGQPITLLEAWAAGLPVVVTAVGDNPRMVRDGVNGWLAEPGNAEGLAGVLKEAMGMPREKLAKMGNRGHGLVKEKYTWERVAGETVKVYQKALGR
jgi:glycosyltransferase involved in cell wall biosynthesis